jgi:hypothetical protein
MDHEGEDYECRDELACLETNEYMKRARRVHVTLAEFPLPEGATSIWHTAYNGQRYIIYPVLAKYKQAVEAAEYERAKRRREGKELWIKWFTAVVSTIAAIASVYSALTKK